MKYCLLLLIFLSLYACGYPDIDSVPDFDDLVITKEEAIDLCNLSNTDKKDLTDCLKKIDTQE
tara:strand:+ start:152 stop:340 length:189 start_codon:yes stop_codon:yes gene_type:complete